MSKPIQSELARLDALITRCEALAEQSPGIYRLRVGLLAYLGIVVVLAVVVGSVVLSVLLIFAIAGLSIMINELVAYGANLIGLDYHGHNYVHVVGGGVALLPLLFAFSVLKSLWLKIPAPAGVDVDRRSAPRLIEEIQSIRKRLGTLTVHRVVIAPEEFNAGVVQVPRLGPLGCHRNHLVVGLPLLEALSPEQFRAVIGHELGHLSRKQTRFRNWIYRSRQSWSRIAYELIREGHGIGVLLLAPFLRWYSAYFGAYTFVLARANEYDADKASAEVAGRDNTAAALTTIAAKGLYLGHKFWSDLNKRAAVDPQPPAHPFENYLGIARALPASEVEAGLAHALAATTSHSDTHPRLTDRLKALDMPPQRLAPLAVTAGEALLGDLRSKLIGDTDALWAAKLASSWKGAHERALARQAQIAELAAGAVAGRLDAEGLFRYALLLEEAEEPAQAMPWLDAVLQQRPEHASALFMRGRLKLSNGDEDGIREIAAAMQLDGDALEPGSQILFDYFYQRRDITRGQPFFDNLERIAKQRRQAEAARLAITDADSFLPHELDAASVRGFAEACASEPRVKRAWLARKHFVDTPERPLFVCVVEYRWGKKRAMRMHLNAIVEAMPDLDRKLIFKPDRPAIARKIAAVDGSLIYTRQ